MPLAAQAEIHKYAALLVHRGKCDVLTQPCRDVLDIGSEPIARSPRYGPDIPRWW